MSFLLQLAAGMGLSSTVGSALSPLSAWIQQEVNKAFPVTKPTPAELVNLRFRKEIDEKSYIELMGTYGINADFAKKIAAGQESILGATENIVMFRRGLLAKDAKKNEEKFYSNMELLGIQPETAKLMNLATLNYESPQEIILWLVREVLDKNKREQLRLDEDYPKAADEFADINGIPKERMRNIWAAHWVNATPEQLARVLQRYHPDNKKFWESEINELGLNPEKVATDIQQLKDLLKFNDVAPFYREKVASLAFDDLGVIEIRWAIRFKFVKFDEATYLYQRRGLPRPLAARVAQIVFVVQNITDWQDAIRLGAMKFSDIEKELAEWKIDKKELIELVKRKVAPQMIEGVKDEKDFTKALIKDGYINGLIDRTKAIELLDGLNYGDEQIKLMLEVWEITRQKKESAKSRKEKDLAKSDIRNRFIQGLSDANATALELKEQGFADSAIVDLLELWTVQAEAKKK